MSTCSGLIVLKALCSLWRLDNVSGIRATSNTKLVVIVGTVIAKTGRFTVKVF